MKAKTTRLDSIRVQNFKAIHDSGTVKLTPLTVLIGNNGSGKSSLVEALGTVQTMATEDIDRAMQLWHGIEHIRYKGKKLKSRNDETSESKVQSPIEFHLRGWLDVKKLSASSLINERGRANEVYFESESIDFGTTHERRQDNKFQTTVDGKPGPLNVRFRPSDSMFSITIGWYVEEWQFLQLSPQNMGQPRPQTRTRAKIHLAADGSNVAEYLMEIRRLDPAAFQGIIDALQFVLPYASDMQPTITSELERAVYLQMTEGHFKAPGWLLSTGTLRVLALLACLRHPNPPPLLVVEEIENGLDPRTLHLVVEEIRAAITAGTTQVILTTHSPYLLDLLDLSHIVVVEREDGQPVFRRPDAKALNEWSKSFSPGRLYTMGRLTNGDR
jgi:predicted ATPase